MEIHSQLEWIIGIDNQRCLTSVSQQSLTHATSKLGKGVEQKQSDYQPKKVKTEK